MSLSARLQALRNELPDGVCLVAVSKNQPVDAIRAAYDAGQRLFAESRVPELLAKREQLPPNTQWHFIGHLQTNKVKHIAPFISLVQSVDQVKLLDELERRAAQHERRIRVLLQVHIAAEAHKFGFPMDEAEALAANDFHTHYPHLTLSGLMGMATFTRHTEQIQREFAALSACFARLKATTFAQDADFCELSIGMSGDYLAAIAAGSTMVRIGTRIFEKQ
jgi:pyridoxal phosphate enzyme (YggS family)